MQHNTEIIIMWHSLYTTGPDLRLWGALGRIDLGVMRAAKIIFSGGMGGRWVGWLGPGAWGGGGVGGEDSEASIDGGGRVCPAINPALIHELAILSAIYIYINTIHNKIQSTRSRTSIYY